MPSTRGAWLPAVVTAQRLPRRRRGCWPARSNTMPNGSLLKYFGETGGPEHGGGQLMWPGTMDGFPVRGKNIPDLKQEELENILLEQDFKSEMFELWDPEQKKRYDKIKDRIANGLYIQFDRRVIDRPDKN